VLDKFVRWMMGHRFMVLWGILLITVLFGTQIFKLEVKTNLNDLLPQNHPFIKVHP